MRLAALLVCCWYCSVALSQDTSFLKVHFLYGSKPAKGFKATEKKWFGGILGGHAGIEGDNGIVNFIYNGRFHWFARKHNHHGAFIVSNENEFYNIMGKMDSVKKKIIYIPVTAVQEKLFDSISLVYLKNTPYDYALFGMRCGAATYDILARLNILPSWSYGLTWRNILYPKKLRKRLLKKAAAEHWRVIKQEGTYRRKWEQD